MKIIRLTADNFLRLRAVDIAPTGDVVKVSGANGQGKTSTLDAIYAALDHRRIAATDAIHKGAKKATIKLDLGEITVQRVITQKSTELHVTMADGTKVASPQTFLAKLLGELSFDPLAFDRMQPKEQFEQLRRAVRIDFDFDANAKARQRVFDQRSDANRQAKSKRAQYEAFPPGGPTEPVDEKFILDRMEQASARATEIEQHRQKAQSYEQHANSYEGQAKRHRQRAEELRVQAVEEDKKAADCMADATKALELLGAMPDEPEPIDVSAEREALARAQAHNAAVERNQRKNAVLAEVEAADNEAMGLTAALNKLDEEKQRAIAAAPMPVAGLSLGEDVVMFNGFPYAQASSAERLRISMGIAMAANPKVRVIRISDGSLLDSKSWKVIEEMAKASDFQVWCEIVDESKKIGIVIEDGAVVAVNQ